MRTRNVMLVLLLVLGVGSQWCWALTWGPELVDDPSIETVPQTAWSLGGRASHSSSYAYDGNYSIKMHNNDYAGTAYVSTSQNITTVGNRLHCYIVRVYEPDGTISLNNYLQIDGQTVKNFITGYPTQWSTGYPVPMTSYRLGGSGNVDVLFNYRSALPFSTSQAVYWDTLSLKREQVVPLVASDSAYGLIPGQTVTVTFSNVGGSINGENIYFDPDVTVTSSEAAIYSVTWVSDTEVDVQLQALQAGDINLTFYNQYSGKSFVYTLKTFYDGPFPAPFMLTDDYYPNIMMGVGYSAPRFASIKAMGCDMIHHYGLGPRDTGYLCDDVDNAVTTAIAYLDLAAQYDLRVMVNLNVRDWHNKTDGLLAIMAFAHAIKDHEALGYWYLADEPEGYTTGTALEPFYNMLKELTPDVPVAIAHCDCTGWTGFNSAQDISMPDYYPIRDVPSPSVDYPVSSLHTRSINYNGTSIPINQSYNRRYDGGCDNNPDCDDYRYPDPNELRYWAYGDLVLGARGAAWYCYGCATEKGFGTSWIENTFGPVNREFNVFTKLVEPATSFIQLHDGTSTDDYVYAGLWQRTNGTWLVAVNSRSYSRNITITTSPTITAGDLTPWGRTRYVTGTIQSGGFTVTAEPWEVFVWLIE